MHGVALLFGGCTAYTYVYICIYKYVKFVDDSSSFDVHDAQNNNNEKIIHSDLAMKL